MRKCHDHERLSFNRRTNKEYRECAASYLSVLLSGTPAQVKPLIPSSENGLFSRQLFYFMPSIAEWTSQFHADGMDYDQRFSTWGHQWKQAVEEAQKNGISPNTLDTQLRRMVEKGVLVKNGRGEYAFSSRVRTCVRKMER